MIVGRLQQLLAGHADIENRDFTQLLAEVAVTLCAELPVDWFDQNPLNAANLELALRAASTQTQQQKNSDLYNKLLSATLRLICAAASGMPSFERTAEAGSVQRLASSMPEIAQSITIALQIESHAVGDGSSEARREADYRHEIVQSLDYVELFGADLPPESRRHALSVAYVSLSLEQQGRDGPESRLLPTEDLLATLGPSATRLLVRGEAGSGKSTLFRWIAIQAAQLSSQRVYPTFQRGIDSSHGTSSWQSRIPILVRLRDCKHGRLPDPDGFPALAAQLFQHHPAGWFSGVLKASRGLVLLDGVDEVPTDAREDIRRQLEKLLASYRGNYFVLSTRPEAVPPRWLNELGFREARLNPMTARDREQFIVKWHKAIAEELAKQGRNGGHLRETAALLKEKLNDSPPIARLATNPLLCAMICALHNERRHILPESQSELCEALCQMLLHRREIESGLALQEFAEEYRSLAYEDKRAIVENIAFYMVQNGESSIGLATAERKVADGVQRQPRHAGADPAVICRALIERSGLLREPRPGHVDFIHNTFKEYLASNRFVSDEHIGQLAARADDASWQPVIFFSAATRRHGFATRLIERILQSNGSSALGSPSNDSELAKDGHRRRVLIALRCRAVALDLEPALNAQLDTLRAALFPPRSLADAEVLAMGGDTLVPYLQRRPEYSVQEKIICLRALRLIGTSRAMRAMREYLNDRAEAVVEELAQALDPLEIPSVQDMLRSHRRLPETIARQVTDLTHVDAIADLTELDLRGTRVHDLLPLTKLRKLRSLSVDGSHIGDISPIDHCESLNALTLERFVNFVTDTLGKMKRLKQRLQSLVVFSSGIDLEILSDYHNLNDLQLIHAEIIQFRCMSNLRNLQSLTLSLSSMQDLSPLRALTKLTNLTLSCAECLDISFIANCTKLEVLQLFSDVKDLSLGKNLNKLRELHIQNSNISNINILEEFQELQRLTLRATQVFSLEPLRKLEKLIYLDIRNSPIRDLTFVSHVKEVLSDTLSKHETHKLEPLGKSIKTSISSTPTETCHDLIILTPLKEEWDELLAVLDTAIDTVVDPLSREYSYDFRINSYRCRGAFIGEMGETESALAVQRFVNLNPKLVVLLGIAGALHPDVKLGDVVAADVVDSYLSRSKAVSSPRTKGRYELELAGAPYRCSSALLNEVQNLQYAHAGVFKEWQSRTQTERARLMPDQGASLMQTGAINPASRIHKGHMACGPIVAASASFKDFLRQQRDRSYLAVEMEAAGLLTAMWKAGRENQTLVLRGISDTGDENKANLDGVGKGAIRRFAMRNAAAFLVAMMKAGVLPRNAP